MIAEIEELYQHLETFRLHLNLDHHPLTDRMYDMTLDHLHDEVTQEDETAILSDQIQEFKKKNPR